MAKFDPTRTPGAIGIPPPPDAPRETTLPGSERALPEQIALARRNEVDQPMYAPKPMSDEQAAAFLGKSVDEVRQLRAAEQRGTAPAPVTPAPTIVLTDAPAVPVAPATTLRRVSKPMPSVHAAAVESVAIEPESVLDVSRFTPEGAVVVDNYGREYALIDAGVEEAPDAVPAPPPATPTEPALPPILPHQRAGSNSDSPSRGVPAPIPDPGKKITGGFGDVGEAQYFALDGIETRRVVESLLAELQKRIVDDLRFSIAATYPRVNIRVAIEVSCFGNDSSFQIVKHFTKEKTPIDVARRHADECCFVIQAEHVEMTEDGESVTPPDKARVALGMAVPRKQAVQTPAGRMIVDLKQ